jgi:hypothetical protein
MGNTQSTAPPHWCADATHPSCAACAAAFGVARRRHHCRACGDIFCSACCPKHADPQRRRCAGCAQRNRHDGAADAPLVYEGPLLPYLAPIAAAVAVADLCHGRHGGLPCPGLALRMLALPGCVDVESCDAAASIAALQLAPVVWRLHFAPPARTGFSPQSLTPAHFDGLHAALQAHSCTLGVASVGSPQPLGHPEMPHPSSTPAEVFLHAIGVLTVPFCTVTPYSHIYGNGRDDERIAARASMPRLRHWSWPRPLSPACLDGIAALLALRTLSLCRCVFADSDGAERLGAAVGNLRCLQLLDMSFSVLGSFADRMAPGLARGCARLKYLNLADSGLDDAGAAALVPALRGMKRLLALYVGYNASLDPAPLLALLPDRVVDG